MAYRCRWLAARGRERDDVLDDLHLQVVDELVEPVYDPGLYAVEVDDWLVVIGDGANDASAVKRAQAAQLSGTGDVVFLSTDDTTMTFVLAMFGGGTEHWAITYDGRDAVTDPTLEGQVPLAARVMLARLEKEQAKSGGPKADVDHVYTLGATYANELVGFHHTTTLGSGDHVPVWALAPRSGRKH